MNLIASTDWWRIRNLEVYGVKPVIVSSIRKRPFLKISDTSDLFPEEKQEEEENHVDELSADDIFGGKENNDEVDQPEEENDIPHDNEDDSVESQNDKLETESELEDEENESEKKKSDNAQKSFFDTFDEN